MQRYESYKASGAEWLGDVPSHWDVKQLRWMADHVERGSAPTYADDGVLVINQACLSTYKLNLKKAKYHQSKEDLKKFRGFIKQGDVLVASTGRGVLGKCCFVESEVNGFVDSHVSIVRDSKDRLPAKFLFYILSTQYEMINACLAEGSTNQTELQRDSFRKLSIPLPPSDERESIVAFLDQKTSEIEVAIAKKEQLIDLLREQKKILINKTVMCGLNPNAPTRNSEVEWIGSIPTHYQLTRLGFVATIGNGSTPNRSISGYWNGGNIPWLNSSKVNDSHIVEAGQFITKRAARECHLPLVPAGSLLVAITGEGKTRGMAAMTKIDATINQHLACITVTDPNVEPEFLLYYLTGIYQVLRDESSSQGTTKGAITCGELRKVPVVLPPLDEQRAILVQIKDQIRRIEQSLATAQSQIASLHELKSIVIADVVSGRMRI